MATQAIENWEELFPRIYLQHAKGDTYSLPREPNPIAADHLRSLVSYDCRFLVYDKGNDLKVVVGDRTSAPDADSSANIVIHTIPADANQTFLTFEDIQVATERHPKALSALATRAGLLTYTGIQIDPRTGQKAKGKPASAEMYREWGSAKGVDVQGHLSRLRRLSLVREFAIAAGVIQELTIWDSWQDIGRMLNTLNKRR